MFHNDDDDDDKLIAITSDDLEYDLEQSERAKTKQSKEQILFNCFQ